MKYKMEVIERLRTLQVLPQEGNIAMFRTMTKLRTILSLTEKEIKEFDFKTEITKNEEGKELQQTTWNEKGKEKIPIEISEPAREIIMAQLKKLDREKKVTPEFIPVFDLFMPEEIKK